MWSRNDHVDGSQKAIEQLLEVALMFLSMFAKVKVDGIGDGLRDAQEAKFHRCTYFHRWRKSTG